MTRDMLSIEGYADRHGVATRTVRRWLSACLLPGAEQDRRGRWSIPATIPPPDLRPVKRNTIEGETVAAPYVVDGDGYGTIPLLGDGAWPVVRHDPGPVVAVPPAPAPGPGRFRLWWTAAEVAELDGRTSVDVVRAMCAAGEINATKHGSWRIPAGEVARLAGWRS